MANMKEGEYYIESVNPGDGSLLLTPSWRNNTREYTNRVLEVFKTKEKVVIIFPKRKIKMTLEEVCKELGKDIEIIN